LDNDEPGRKASYKLAEKCIRLGYRADILFAPEDRKDFNEWARSLRRAVKAETCDLD
jgi:DNA primase